MPLYSSPSALPMWVIYAHPRDYPEGFVVRKWFSWAFVWPKGDGRLVPARCPAQGAVAFPTLQLARQHCMSLGGVCVPAYPNDDPVIVESWI